MDGSRGFAVQAIHGSVQQREILWFCGCGMNCWYVLIWNSCVIIEHFQHSLVNCWIKQKKFSLYKVRLICSASSFILLFLFSCVTKHFSLPNVKVINCLFYLIYLNSWSSLSFFCWFFIGDFLALSFSGALVML